MGIVNFPTCLRDMKTFLYVLPWIWLTSEKKRKCNAFFFLKIFQNTKLDRDRPPLQAQQSSRSGPAPCPEGAWKIGEVIRSQWNFWIPTHQKQKNIIWHTWHIYMNIYGIHLLIVLTHYHGDTGESFAPAPASLPNRSHGPGLDIVATHKTPHRITFVYMYVNVNSNRYYIHIMSHMIHIWWNHENHENHGNTSLFKKHVWKAPHVTPNSKITLPLLSSCLIWNDPSHLHHEKTLDFPQIKPITSHCTVSHHISAWTSWNVAFFLDLANVKMSMSNMSNLRSEFHESNIVKQCHMKREHRKHI